MYTESLVYKAAATVRDVKMKIADHDLKEVTMVSSEDDLSNGHSYKKSLYKDSERKKGRNFHTQLRSQDTSQT